MYRLTARQNSRHHADVGALRRHHGRVLRPWAADYSSRPRPSRERPTRPVSPTDDTSARPTSATTSKSSRPSRPRRLRQTRRRARAATATRRARLRLRLRHRRAGPYSDQQPRHRRRGRPPSISAATRTTGRASSGATRTQTSPSSESEAADEVLRVVPLGDSDRLIVGQKCRHRQPVRPRPDADDGVISGLQRPIQARTGKNHRRRDSDRRLD